MAVDAKRFPDLFRVAESKETQVADEELLSSALGLVNPAYGKLSRFGKDEGIGEEAARRAYLVGVDDGNTFLWLMSKPTSQLRKYEGILQEGFQLIRLISDNETVFIPVHLRSLSLPFLPRNVGRDSLDKRVKLELLELAGQNGVDVINATARALKNSQKIDPKAYHVIDAYANDCQLIGSQRLASLGIPVVMTGEN